MANTDFADDDFVEGPAPAQAPQSHAPLPAAALSDDDFVAGPPSDDWGGYLSTAGREFAKGAVTGAGEIVGGIPERAVPLIAGALVPGVGQAAGLAASYLMPKTAPDERGLPERAGKAVKDWASTAIPTTKTEDESLTGQVAHGIGSMAAPMAIGAVTGPIGAAAAFGLQGANEQSEAAREHGASEADREKAAALGFALNAAGGLIPFHAILKPIERSAPGIMDWAVTRLKKAVVDGMIFTTAGEAQDWVGQQIAKAYYDPNAGYSFDFRRALGSYITGGLLGQLHRAKFTPSAVEDQSAKSTGAESTGETTHATSAATGEPDYVAELSRILGRPPTQAEVEAKQEQASAARPPAESESILAPSPGDEGGYVDQAMRNLAATSRTAAGTLDVSNAPGKEKQLVEGLTAEQAKAAAVNNYAGVIRDLYRGRNEVPSTGHGMGQFIDAVAERVNNGIVKPGELARANQTKIAYQTKPEDLAAAHAQFSQELARRLADPNADPVETAAWIEWRANIIDHFWSDGVGKTSKALAAIPLMRAGLPLPVYPPNKDFFALAKNEKPIDPNAGGMAYLTPGWEHFNAFYHQMVDPRRTLQAMIDAGASPEELAKHPLVLAQMDRQKKTVPTGTEADFTNPDWQAQRVYQFGNDRVEGWDNAVNRLIDDAVAFAGPDGVGQDKRAVIILGPPAAGKSTVAEPLAREYRGALIDPDEAKKAIPEYQGGLGTSAVHEESSHLAKEVLKRIARNGFNLILPKVGQEEGSIRKWIDALKGLGYTVDLVHVSTHDANISARRNFQRFLKTGRLVDPKYVAEIGDKPRRVSYILRGEANDFADIDTGHRAEVTDGDGPLADALRTRLLVGGLGRPERTPGRALQGQPVTGIQPHRVTSADGRSVEVRPIVVEASSLITSQDHGYDRALQPRQRTRAASQQQVRDIATNLDPERLGYSSEADRGAPIVGPDSMVESGNGRVLALRSVYERGGDQAQAYRDWVAKQGVDVSGFREPVLVRERTTELSPEERRDFTVASNQAATLAMSAPERALADAGHVDADSLALIHNADDLAAAVNRPFMRRFVASLPQAEQGSFVDAQGRLSAEGLARVRNAILAKAYGDAATLSRIAESTNDEVKSISNALVAAAPQWARLRAEIQAGNVRPDMDVTPQLLEAVSRTADLRAQGIKIDEFLAQLDAFDKPAPEVEHFMRSFYHPITRRAAVAARITDALRWYAQEAGKVTNDKGLNLGLAPIDTEQVTRLMRETKEREDELSYRGRAGDVAHDEAGSREVRGPGLGAAGEGARRRGDLGFEEGAIRAQQPTLEELDKLRGVEDPYKPVRTFPGEEGTEARIYKNADGKRFNVTLYDRDSGQTLNTVTIHPTLEAAEKKARALAEMPAGEHWWEHELTQMGRAAALHEVGIGARPGTAWRHLRPDVQQRLIDARNKAGFAAMVAQNKADRAAVRGEIERGLKEEGSFAVPSYNGGNWLLTPATARDKTPYRITFFDKAGDPTGHFEVRDLDEAAKEMVGHWKKAQKPAPKTETIELAKGQKGEQFVIPGAEKISTAELLRRKSAEPMRASIPQEIPGGLFGDLLGQEELFRNVNDVSEQQLRERPARETPAAVVASTPRATAQEGIGRQQEGVANVAAAQAGEARPPDLTSRPAVPNSATDLFGEAPSARSTRPARGGVRPGTQEVPGGEQPKRPIPAKRPNQLSLFGGEPSGGQVGAPDGGVQPPAGSPEVAGTGPSESVTKPPARSRGTDPARPDLPTPTRAGIREAEQKIAERSRSNYRITDEDRLGEGGPKVKVRQNIDAIRLLKAIEDEGREATPGEKAVLVKYTGWGAFSQAIFDEYKVRPEWEAERAALRALMTDEEWNAARHSTQNAHYTSPDVIRGMWDALSHLGYDGGTALEPAAGVGHFIGLIPDAVAPRTAWTGVELDPLTGRIAKALYGGAEMNVHGFEDLKRPSNYYDLAISNVPFGDIPIREKPYGAFKQIHDFFFVKSLDKVRPGGVVAFVTSKGTMDKAGTRIRERLAKDADLVGAIRLPGGDKGAFAKNAGTQVTTDIIFLRKKIPGEKPFPGAKWLETKEVQTPEGPTYINEYFADNPKMMLGEMRLLGSMYRENEPVLIGDPAGLQQKIADAARSMQAGALAPRIEPATLENLPATETVGVKDGAFFLKDGQMYRRVAGEGIPHPMSKDDHDRVTRFMGIRDLYDKILDAQITGRDAEPDRAKLRAAYKAFVDKYGPINKEETTVTSRKNKEGEPIVISRMPNFRAFRRDPDAWKVSSIENYDAEKGTAKPADIQTKDVLRAPPTREINGPGDALAAALNDTGRVDLDHVAQSLGVADIDQAAGALGDLIYQDPNGRQWKTADDYLSGNVVQKLEEAREIAKSEPLYLRNVAALEKVQPLPIPPGPDITTSFGTPWVPADVYTDFVKEVLGGTGVDLSMSPQTGEWFVEVAHFPTDMRAKYSVAEGHGGKIEKILKAALNNQKVTVRDTVKDEDGNYPVLAKQTEEANNKVALMREAFSGDPEFGIDGWVWQDPERGERLAGIYNRQFNNLANRQFDGSHLTFSGLNPKFSDRQHRKDAVWRVLQQGNTLLAHEVGSGKTVTMIAAGMEQKRLGLIQKPAYVVPNHMLEQFSREFIEAYPNAKILVASKEEMSADQRKAFIAKAAANNWDGVVITHDAFGRINVNRDTRWAHINEQVEQLNQMIDEEMEASGGDKKAPTVKDLERRRDKLADKLQELMNEERKDEGLNFEDTGIDFLFVDEAHLFKNLSFLTRNARVKGLGQGDAQRAEDLFLKMRSLEQNRPGRSAVFATGTPVSNTMAELWTMMRYLELDKLKERGLDNFDRWANTFGKIQTRVELGADGRTLEDVTSFSKFVNVPELVALYSEIADTKTAEMLNLPRPEVKTRSGAPGIEIVKAQPSSAEEAAIQKLVGEAKHMKENPKRPEKGDRIMLNVVTDGRKVATDMRLLDPTADFNPQGKVAKAVENIARIYQEGNKDPDAPNKVQMVFLDMGVPLKKGGEDKIDLYGDMKRRLVDAGVPAKEIGFIHDADNDIKKARLFKDVRAGKIRVLFGSTGKMGVGTNVQDRLIAMHHIDAPWKPAEVTQRDGRIVRQGNMNKAVQLYRYVTEHSFDAFMWQKLDTKAKFIAQVLSGTKGSRVAEDADSPLPEAEEMKAAASGDPRIIEHAELDRTVRGLSSQRRTFESTQARASQDIASAKQRIANYDEALPNARDDAEMVNDTYGDKFSVDLGDKGIMNDRKAAGEAVLAGLTQLDPRQYYRPAVVKIGMLSGFDMNMEIRGGWGGGTETILRATPSLKGKAGYGAANDIVINPHTDAAGLMMRYERILRSIKQEPERLEGLLKNERANVDRLEKTLGEKWPKEKEYKAALAKLSELGDALKAKKHPDVQTAELGHNEEVQAFGERRGEPGEATAPAGRRIELSKGAYAYVSPEYTAAEKKIAKAVQEIAQRMAPQATVQGAKALRLNGQRLWGAFVDSRQFPHFIAWSLERGSAAGAAHTVRHEIIHHLKKAGLFKPEEWEALSKAAKDNGWLDKYDINWRYPHLDEGKKIEEAIAEHFAGWRTERGIEKAGLIRDAFHRLDLLMKRVAAAARRYLGAKATPDDVLTRIETGEVGARRSEQIEARKAAGEGVAASRAPGFYFDAEKSPLYAKRTAAEVGLLTPEKARAALETDATARRIMAKNIKVNDGDMIGARLNLNVMKKTGVPVQALHKGNKGEGYKANRGFWNGEVLGYEPVVTLKDAYLNVHQPARESIARGEAKAPMASVDGKYSPGAHSFDGVEFRFNPKREHLFVDKLGRVLRHADEVTIHGNSVFARGHIEYYGKEDVPPRAGETPSRGRLIEPGVGGDEDIRGQAGEGEVQAQTPEREARERRQALVAAAGGPQTVWGRLVNAGDKLRGASQRFSEHLGLDPLVTSMQNRISPMASRTGTPEARAIATDYMIAMRAAMHRWQEAAKYLTDKFTPEQLEKMWNAADEESVALQQNRTTQGIGLDRLTPGERSVVQFFQGVSEDLFKQAQDLGMIQGEGLPSYVPRILVRMAETGKFERGIGPDSKIVRDFRTLAFANMKLERAIAARRLVEQIREIGEKTGNQTVSTGSIPHPKGADAMVEHAINIGFGKGFSDTTANLKHRKYLTAAETEAAARRAPKEDKDAPKWVTIANSAFQIWRPKMIPAETEAIRNAYKAKTGTEMGKVAAEDNDGNPLWEKVPIYVRDDFAEPLRAVLEQESGPVTQALMSLKGKIMSVVMFSPLIHNQVEWGRAIPAAPGKVLTAQIYFDGNQAKNDPVMMQRFIGARGVPIGGHGFMMDISELGDAQNLEPGAKSWVTQGVGYGTKMLGQLTHIYDPEAGSKTVKRALDKAGNFWHNTLLWDRVADLQMGLFKTVTEDMQRKGHDQRTADLVAAHFANRYAGALPVESMSRAARNIANLLLFSRSFTLGNVATYKDAVAGLPRDVQALILRDVGPDALAQAQNFTKKKSRAMLALDAGLYYTMISLMQSAFHVAGAATTISSLGGATIGSMVGAKFGGRYGALLGAPIGAAGGWGAAALLGAQAGPRTLQEEIDGYWDRFTRLLTRGREHPFQTMFNPLGALTSLLSTAENEPGLEGRMLWGYDKDGRAQYMRLPVGKVTEELMDWFGAPNDILHRKLSTFARPLNAIWSNDIGFGRKLYDPNADTPSERAQNIYRIAAAIAWNQVPVDMLKSARDMIVGPDRADAASKLVSQMTGFTFRQGHPEGPAAGFARHIKDKHDFLVQEAMPAIKEKIRKGDYDGAQADMEKVQMPKGLQDWYLRRGMSGATMSRKMIKDFFGFATDEQADEFARRQEQEDQDKERLHAAGHATGGAVQPEDMGPESDTDRIKGAFDALDRQQRNNPNLSVPYAPPADLRGRVIRPGSTPWGSYGKRVERADGGSVGDDTDYDMAAATAAGVQPDENGHWPDTYKRPTHITFSDESIYHGPENPGGHWERVQGDEWNFTPGTANLRHHSAEELQDYFQRYEPKSHLVLPAKRAHGGRTKVSKASVNYRDGTPEKHCGNCSMYEARTCTLVAGLINPNKVCDRFELDKNSAHHVRFNRAGLSGASLHRSD